MNRKEDKILDYAPLKEIPKPEIVVTNKKELLLFHPEATFSGKDKIVYTCKITEKTKEFCSNTGYKRKKL